MRYRLTLNFHEFANVDVQRVTSVHGVLLSSLGVSTSHLAILIMKNKPSREKTFCDISYKSIAQPNSAIHLGWMKLCI